MKSSIFQIIKALTELEAKGCHSVFFEYCGGMYMIRIYSGDAHTGRIVYKNIINPTKEQAEMDKLSNLIEKLKNRVITTDFQCYMREFVNGSKTGDWIKIKPIFEFGDNSVFSMLCDNSGYYLDDAENGVQYFVDMRQISVT
jgi:hypothetical protein